MPGKVSLMVNPKLYEVLRECFNLAFDKNWLDEALITMGIARAANTIATELWLKNIAPTYNEYTMELRYQILHFNVNETWDLKRYHHIKLGKPKEVKVNG